MRSAANLHRYEVLVIVSLSLSLFPESLLRAVSTAEISHPLRTFIEPSLLLLSAKPLALGHNHYISIVTLFIMSMVTPVALHAARLPPFDEVLRQQ